MPRMTEQTVKDVLQQNIHDAIGYIGGDISNERREALDYYYGDVSTYRGRALPGPGDGRSSVVSTDVQDTIEGIMPDIVEIFTASGSLARFRANKPQDEEFANQAADLVNYTIMQDNDGFGIVHDWIKDALLQKVGYVKAKWDDRGERKREHLTGINAQQLLELDGDPSVEILEFEDEGNGFVGVTLVRTTPSIVKIEAVPPEEVLVSRRARDLRSADFVCHRTRKTASELIAAGYKRKLIESIPSGDEDEFNEERVARFRSPDQFPDDLNTEDASQRPIWVYECYPMIDVDGDGIAERRQITVAGSGYTVLPDPDTGQKYVEIDDHPIFDITPIRMPHKHFGRSLADLALDIQVIKTTLQRQVLDNQYNINNARVIANDRVNQDDYMTLRPGGIVRAKGQEPVSGAVQQLDTVAIAQYLLPQLEYWDTVRETRTGLTRLGQGVDPDSLNKTGTLGGLSMLLGRTQKHVLFIARVMAETGFKHLVKRVLELLIENQDRPRAIKLRGKWIQTDPRSWDATMAVSIDVGLGTGTQEQRAAALGQILEIQRQAIELQQGVNGPLVELKHISHTVRKLTETLGFKNADMFFVDGAEAQQQPQQPQPDPKMIEIQAEDKRKREEMELEDERARLDLQMENAREIEKIRLQDARERLKAGLELQLKRDVADNDNLLKERAANAQIDIADRKARASGGNGSSNSQ